MWCCVLVSIDLYTRDRLKYTPVDDEDRKTSDLVRMVSLGLCLLAQCRLFAVG